MTIRSETSYVVGVIAILVATWTSFSNDINSMVGVQGFLPTHLSRPYMTTTTSSRTSVQPTRLWYVNTDLPDVSEMKASEMKRELETYGISLKSLFDKKDFEKALQEARLQREQTGVHDIKERIKRNEEVVSSQNNKERKTVWGRQKGNEMNERNRWSSSPSSSSATSSSPSSRDDRYKDAFQKGSEMKLSELKQELKDRGISTSAFFEKNEMAKAYAEAIADNVMKKEKKATNFTNDGQVYDPAYRNVIVHQFDASTLLPSDKVIDITGFVKGTSAGA
jgi:predicted HTH domain antitoxin